MADLTASFFPQWDPWEQCSDDESIVYYSLTKHWKLMVAVDGHERMASFPLKTMIYWSERRYNYWKKSVSYLPTWLESD
jgi:hypothetical protein